MSGVVTDDNAMTEPPEAETIDGLPVLAEVRPIEQRVAAGLPMAQAAAAAATGFLAGAAAIALLRWLGARKPALPARGAPRRAAELLPVVGTRTFLIDIHLIGKTGE